MDDDDNDDDDDDEHSETVRDVVQTKYLPHNKCSPLTAKLLSHTIKKYQIHKSCSSLYQ